MKELFWLPLVLCLLACQKHDSSKINYKDEKQNFGIPFYGAWSGQGRGSILAPDLFCENIQIVIEPTSFSETISIRSIDGVCNNLALNHPGVILSIKDQKVFNGSEEIGKASNNQSYENGRWLTFRAKAPVASEMEIFFKLMFFSSESGGPALGFYVSFGGNLILVSSLKKND